MDIVLAFSALCILLVVGKILRVTIRLFQKLYLPASVIGGLLGLRQGSRASRSSWLPGSFLDGLELLLTFTDCWQSPGRSTQ